MQVRSVDGRCVECDERRVVALWWCQERQDRVGENRGVQRVIVCVFLRECGAEGVDIPVLVRFGRAPVVMANDARVCEVQRARLFLAVEAEKHMGAGDAHADEAQGDDPEDRRQAFDVAAHRWPVCPRREVHAPLSHETVTDVESLARPASPNAPCDVWGDSSGRFRKVAV